MLEGEDHVDDLKEDLEMLKFRHRRASTRLVRHKSFLRQKVSDYTDRDKQIDLNAYGRLSSRLQSIDEMIDELRSSNSENGETPGLLQISIKEASNLDSPKLEEGELPTPTCQILIWRTNEEGKKFAKLRDQTQTCDSTKSPIWNSVLTFRVDNILDLSIMLSVKHLGEAKSFLLGRTKPLDVVDDLDSDIDIDFFDKYQSDWNTVDLKKGGSVTFRYEWSPKSCGLYVVLFEKI